MKLRLLFLLILLSFGMAGSIRAEEGALTAGRIFVQGGGAVEAERDAETDEPGWFHAAGQGWHG